MMKPKLKELAERGKFSFLVALAITAMLVLGTTANAQVGAGGNYSTLKGVVTEKGTKAVPVEFAAVIVNPQGSAGMTDKNGEFNLTMILAAVSGTLILVGFIAFFYNIVMSVGLKGVIGIFTPAKLKTEDLVPQN